jgi:hypothetical protein
MVPVPDITVKGKAVFVFKCHTMETYGENEVKLHAFLTMALHGTEQTLVPTD